MAQPFGSALLSCQGAVLAGLLTMSVPTRAPCMVELMEGNEPIDHFNDAAWPGLLAVVNDASRVLFASGPTTEQTAFYQGDTTALQRVLHAFSAVELEERLVVLRPGRGDSWPWTNKTSFYDWRLQTNQWGGWRAPVAKEDLELIRQPHPTLTVFVGGAVDLDRLKIPGGITLVGVDRLRERLRRGLLSRNDYVRSVAASRLSRIDPYGNESAAAIEKLPREERAWKPVEKAQAEFRERAADPPEVRSKYEEEERRIRDFIFAWRYRWLKVAVAVGLAVAAVFLVATVFVGRARRTHRAQAR